MNNKYKLKELSIEEEFEHLELTTKFNEYQAQLLQINALITDNEEEEVEKQEMCFKIAVIVNTISEQILNRFYSTNE